MRRSTTVLRIAGRIPLQILALGTTAKSFRENPVIGSPILNRLGLHVLRVVLAHAIMRLRRLWFAPFVTAAIRERFAGQGYLVLPDFLPADDFAAFAEELRGCSVAPRVEIAGDTMTTRVLLDDAALSMMPVTRAVIAQARYRKVSAYAAARSRVPAQFLQRICSGVHPGGRDPQRDLHGDTFHPTMKSWLFVDDVDDAQGPITYVPGSHRLTLRRLAWEYRRSRKPDSLPFYSAQGSLRVDESELPGLGLPAPIALCCRANTLIVADTRGFHRRGDAQPGSERLELWSMSRTNPFNPTPGLPFAWLDRLDRRGLAIFLRRRDAARSRETRSASI